GPLSDAARIQAYFRTSASRAYDAVPVPPFTAFFHAEDDLAYFNYAIPDEPVRGELAEPLERLRAEFVGRSRVPRFEYVEGFAPEFASSLRAAGFALELRAPLMACTPGRLRRPAGVAGLRIDAIDETSPLGLVQDSITITRRAFGSGDEQPAT